MKATNPITGVPFTENEADYWGTISQIDMAVGRVRALLAKHGVADNTWVSITADNGPEVNPAGGQGTGTVSANSFVITGKVISHDCCNIGAHFVSREQEIIRTPA